MTGHDDSPIEAYLDDLFVELRGTPPRDARHLLAETEAHLHDAAADEIAGGTATRDAESVAVTRFGATAPLVRDELRRQGTPLRALVRGSMTAGWFLGAVGAIAVGASGIAAAGLRLVGGATFIANTPSSAVLTASNCARWLRGYHDATTCRQAAISDWAFETVAYRVALGLLGLVALAVFVVVRRRWTRAGRWTTLPATVVDSIAVTAFGAGGVWMAGLGVDAVTVASGHGAGQWLSAAPVALIVAAVFGFRLVNDLRSPAPA